MASRACQLGWHRGGASGSVGLGHPLSQGNRSNGESGIKVLPSQSNLGISVPVLTGEWEEPKSSGAEAQSCGGGGEAIWHSGRGYIKMLVRVRFLGYSEMLPSSSGFPFE